MATFCIHLFAVLVNSQNDSVSHWVILGNYVAVACILTTSIITSVYIYFLKHDLMNPNCKDLTF